MFNFKPATTTTTTSTPSLFAPSGSQPQATPGTGATNMFGAASTNSAQPAASGGSGGFTFGQPASSTSNASGQTQTNSLFGGAAPAAQGQAGATGSTGSGGIFGGAAAPAGGSLFGQPSTAATGQPGQGQAGGGGMFGAGTQAQGAGSGTGSIFGKPATTFGQAAPASTSLFGSTTAAQPATGSGIAGSAPGQFSTFSTSIGQPQNQQQSQPSIFGQPQAQPQGQQPQAGAFGQFGQQQQQQQGQSQLAQSQQQQQNDGGLQKGTKFSDLPEGHQNALKEMEKRINDRKRVGASLSTTGMDEAVRQIERQVQDVSRQTSALSSTLSSITSSISTLQTRLRAEGVDMAHLVEIIETMSYNPSASTSQQPANTAGGGAGGMSMSVGMGLSSSTSGGVNDNRVGAARLSAAHKEWVLGYFEKMAGEMRGRIGIYRARIAELHRVIEGLGRESEGTTPQAIAQTIDNHQNAIVNLAAHIERVEMRLDEMRDQLRTFHQRNFNTMRDVFDMAREEQGLPVKSQVMLQSLTQSMRI